jgi:hypothetical protein
MPEGTTRVQVAPTPTDSTELADEWRAESHEAVREPGSPVGLFANDDRRIGSERVGGSRDSVLVPITPRVRLDVRGTDVAISGSRKLEEAARGFVDAHGAKVNVWARSYPPGFANSGGLVFVDESAEGSRRRSRGSGDRLSLWSNEKRATRLPR